MPITLRSNVASIGAQRRLAEATSSLSRTFERLASGQRINRARDDAAGLAIAESLNVDGRIYNQGVRNLNDGLSLLNIGESALESLSTIMTRLEELAQQAASGTYGTQQRKALDIEAQALSKEFFRITKTTEFNGLDLLGGSLNQVNLQAGYGTHGVLPGGVGGAIGTGTFAGASSYATESFASTSVVLGDLDGDGVLDLVTAGYLDGNAGSATVRLGLGNGSFGVGFSYAAESGRSNSVTLGDLNGDGVLDLVTAGNTGSGAGHATVRLGLGNGSFAAGTSYAAEAFSSEAVTLGDLNGDGVLDLVTAGYSGIPIDGYATVRLGIGNGSFGVGISYATESGQSRSVTLGDLNGDGVLDLVTAGRSDSSVGYVTRRLGLGNGSFAVATSYVEENVTSRSVMLGDLNGDGVLDIATAGFGANAAGNATVRLGLGNGSFAAATSYAAESADSYSTTLGDLDGDGVLDLVTAGRAVGIGNATVRRGLGDGRFGGATSYASEVGGSGSVTLGDLNGDGVLDLVTAGNTGGDGYATMRLSSTQDGVNPLLPFSLRTLADARQALPVFKRKRELLESQRGQMGAFQSRIGVAVNVLQASSENFKNAESQMRDPDIAAEAADLVRRRIVQEAAAGVLAQANQQPAMALLILQSNG